MAVFLHLCVEINEDQPLHKVIFQLERLGYRQLGVPSENVSSIRTCKIEGSHCHYFEFLAWHINAIDEQWKRVTLKTLKSLNKARDNC